MSRVTYLSELYEKSAPELTKTRESWKGLLSCMARYYKYSFDNNVLIYTQRPDASQLATMDVWNKIGRRVNRGGKSIAVIDLSNPKASLKCLFDLMDINGKPRKSQACHGLYVGVGGTVPTGHYRKVSRQVRYGYGQHRKLYLRHCSAAGKRNTAAVFAGFQHNRRGQYTAE